MDFDGAQRRRTTVMSADVVGYSAMMAVDATATLRALLMHLRQIERLVRQFGGRIVDAPGDNVLIEFPQETSALLCAVELQRRLGEDALHLSGAPRMHFRIGLHSGDALVRNGRLYGDAVNIAARLQAAAEPDGILVSESIAERTPLREGVELKDMGLRWLKNIPYQVATYRLAL